MEELKTKMEPAKGLSNGWFWIHFSNDSGYLRAPNKKHYFSYNKAPYATRGCIGYRMSKEKEWIIFWGTFKDFKFFAEEKVAIYLNSV